VVKWQEARKQVDVNEQLLRNESVIHHNKAKPALGVIWEACSSGLHRTEAGTENQLCTACPLCHHPQRLYSIAHSLKEKESIPFLFSRTFQKRPICSQISIRRKEYKVGADLVPSIPGNVQGWPSSSKWPRDRLIHGGLTEQTSALRVLLSHGQQAPWVKHLLPGTL
jgi:hypothetical protein